ncbi:hypothetical protein HETIRDRAFT_420229 [Heterobasidion irregulare TC 32-1]|uniref:Uncharacterized protein n=1 Tax=Heterobasidion irregulare (strain TC 32-1) TaxID=747525 RepID=W4JZP9_HETIT|nr:uncharacterized protein HETIRDRAFT_420229 [Heterobasidion irregulare TC 32-1]ETW79053.1 hypothetical protein HETIRDRAFT_420229 [Heterobasidion irregulare TC 32-1]
MRLEPRRIAPRHGLTIFHFIIDCQQQCCAPWASSCTDTRTSDVTTPDTVGQLHQFHSPLRERVKHLRRILETIAICNHSRGGLHACTVVGLAHPAMTRSTI